MTDTTRLNVPRLHDVNLNDKYDLSKETVLMSGTQALVRLTMMQKQRDRQNGLNTAGFVSGYRGSPLGGVDQTFMRCAKQLAPYDVKFVPGLNEELAATAVWGTQQAEMRGEGAFDGVFGIWYGKGPGVDRSGDVFRHANMAGSSKNGGVLCLMGDDHTAESSTVAHQSDFHFVDVMVPILNPAGVQEILDYGLYGWALSRYSGNWVALKCMKDTVESTAVVDGRVDRLNIVYPTAEEFQIPEGGLNIRPYDDRWTQEVRLHMHKRAATLAFVRANKINKIITSGGKHPKIGIITTGKSYLDVRQAFDDLAIDEVRANDLGLRLFKIGCVWPIDPQELKAFIKDLDLVIVVEEKRSLIEVQVREELYGSGHEPTVIGKKDEQGQWLFPVHGALEANDIALCIGERILKHIGPIDSIARRLDEIKASQDLLKKTESVATRVPYFCSGCPHNTSTKVPEGGRGYAGIGCHYMVSWMPERRTEGVTQMGGEGSNWIGEAPFSTRKHVFQNLGDGTYNHSGSLALRFAIATNTTITYKILFNDAVAMTGGQRHEGGLTAPEIARQVAAEGVKRIAFVSDEPYKYAGTGEALPAQMSYHHRDDLELVQKELVQVEGVSVILYDQTCAAEKRRRRKRGEFPDPQKRIIINDLVCEGCGDCGVQSNCVSVQPLETEFGRKRTIDQSSCNKDFSCQNGFCPSFVMVHGAEPKKGKAIALTEADLATVPEPSLPAYATTFNLLVTGIGGTGIVTVGAILSMAAHLEGKAAATIDMAGLAQKGGEVFSHIRFARKPEDIHTIRIGAGQADVLISGDIVVAGTKKVLAALKTNASVAVVNTHEMLPGPFAMQPDLSLPTERLKRAITSAAGENGAHLFNAQAIATALMGNSIATNLFLVGYAYQKGALPLSASAIERAIQMNGEAISMNISAFRWGRLAAHDYQKVLALATPKGVKTSSQHLSETLEEMIERRMSFLTSYQNAAYAMRYKELVDKVIAAETKLIGKADKLSKAAARYMFKLMAYKDEYEVARLFTDGSFEQQVRETFDGKNLRYEFHFAPPLLARKDPNTGLPIKAHFGAWFMTALKIMARLKGLRGTPFDIFGYTHERRVERKLISTYEGFIAEITQNLSAANYKTAIELLSVPEKIRGYGHVKDRNLEKTRAEEALLLNQFRNGTQEVKLAAE